LFYLIFSFLSSSQQWFLLNTEGLRPCGGSIRIENKEALADSRSRKCLIQIRVKPAIARKECEWLTVGAIKREKLHLIFRRETISIQVGRN
jgi:hypothetical protein